MPNVIINGTEYEVREGRNMLEAAIDNGLDLPYFCWHPAMGSVGSCRLCAVRVYRDASDTKGKIQMACMTPAVEGTRMDIDDPEAAEFRRYVIEWLMTNHPHDCPVCDEGGECHLQDMTVMCGQVYRRYSFRKRTYTNQYLGPLVNHELNRCIQCYRCVRYYRDLAGGKDLNVFGSKNRVYFGRQESGVLESEFSGNLVEVCPTGVFTDKTYDAHYTRKWDLETAPSVCIHCGLGCNTIPGVRYDTVRRVTARFNSEVNGYFLCDRGRYGYHFVNDDSRVREPALGTGSDRRAVSWDEAVEAARVILCDAKGVVAIGSPRAWLEANYTLKQLVGNDNYSTGLSAFEQRGVDLALEILREGPARTPSLAEVEDADVVVVLGADPTNEAPMLDFAIRQAMRKAPLDIARKLNIPDWDANAVATALQDAKGKLYVVAPWSIKIEEITGEHMHASPDGIIEFAARLAGTIRHGWATEGEMVTCAAKDLAEARQPLIVTSISAGPEVMKAAANIAWALCGLGKDCRLSIIVPEANTMGVGMLGGFSVDEALARIESGEADTLIVMENDLARRADPAILASAMDKAKHVIALDCIRTGTTEAADVLIPAPTCIETNGTFVNNEGRAQRFYQVFVPPFELSPIWRLMREFGAAPIWSTYDGVLADMACDYPDLASLREAAPPADWRSPSDQKVARMPHRYSGRTAKHADRTVFEPMPPADPNTPLAFTMEGEQGIVPGPLVPRFWYPGWNSEAATNKFQIEVGGPLHGGVPGKRLIEPSGRRTEPFEIAPIEPAGRGEVWVVPKPHIFGSEELSRIAPWLIELTPPARITVHPNLAKRMGMAEGKEAEIELGGQVRTLPAHIDESIAEDVVSIPANFQETIGVTEPVRTKPEKGV